MKKLRLAHCSDIHLDSSVHAGGGSDRYRAGFDLVLRRMVSHDPDLVLIAGDLFDSNRATHDTITWAMSRLGEVGRPVVMIPGNHDCLEERAIYRRYDFAAIDNVTTLFAAEGELASFDQLGVVVWGRGMVDHHPGFVPLAGCPGRPSNADFYLGLGHGIYVPQGESTHRSSPVRAEDIESSPCDYLALGHHHAALDVSVEATPAAYCGSPTDSVDQGETYVIVEMTSGSPARVAINEVGNDGFDDQ